MNNFVTKTGEYYNGVLNMFNSTLLNYNYPTLQLLNSSKDNNIGYNTGSFGSTTTTLYGKPLKTQELLNSAFDKLLSDLDDETLPIFSTFGAAVTNAQKRIFKSNYKKFVTNTYKETFIGGTTEPVNTLVQIEQDYVYNVDRLNFVVSGSTNGQDGKLNDKNIAVIFSTTGNSETVNGASIDTYTSLKNDYTTIANNNNQFISALTSANLFVPTAFNSGIDQYTLPAGFDGLSSSPKKIEYLCMSVALSDKNKTTFVNDLIVGLDQTTKNVVENYYGNLLYNEYKKYNENGISILNGFKDSETGQTYVKYTPTFGTTQTRIFAASENSSADEATKKTLQSIYANKNDSNNFNPYNFKRKFN
jgi:hypothetical protein